MVQDPFEEEEERLHASREVLKIGEMKSIETLNL
jgi:hypothetical protein